MSFIDDLLGIGREALRDGLSGSTVSVKTNYGPEFRIKTEGESGSDLLGIRAGLIIRNRNGQVIETVGDPAPTDPLKFGALVIVVVGVGFVLFRGLLPRVRKVL